jgi:hypothetical protein
VALGVGKEEDATMNPSKVAVPYQTPHQRAYSSAQRTALSAMVALIVTPVIPLLIEFLTKGDWSAPSLKSLGTAVGVAALTVVFNYYQKRSEAYAEGVAPAVSDLPLEAAAYKPGEPLILHPASTDATPNETIKRATMAPGKSSDNDNHTDLGIVVVTTAVTRRDLTTGEVETTRKSSLEGV